MSHQQTHRLFVETDLVADLVEADYETLTLLSRFSLPLGFGDKTIDELCRISGIKTDVFLLTVNFILTGGIDNARLERVSPGDVAEFLHNSHNYYLDYKFPHIRGNMLAALDPAQAQINPIIVKYFDDYIESGKSHFEYEETVLFPYVARLERGERCGYSADDFLKRHDHDVEDNLSELKNIILRYYTTSVPYRMYDVLVDICNCEADLKVHSEIENRILVPLLRRLEQTLS